MTSENAEMKEITSFILIWVGVIGLPIATCVAIIMRWRWIALTLYILTLAILAALVMPAMK